MLDISDSSLVDCRQANIEGEVSLRDSADLIAFFLSMDTLSTLSAQDHATLKTYVVIREKEGKENEGRVRRTWNWSISGAAINTLFLVTRGTFVVEGDLKFTPTVTIVGHIMVSYADLMLPNLITMDNMYLIGSNIQPTSDSE